MPTKPKSHSDLLRAANIGQQRRDYDRHREQDPRLGRAKRIRSSARWTQYRGWFIRHHPLCADPFGDHRSAGVTVAAAHAHHIKPLVDHPELAFEESNLAALCVQCHGQIEGMVKAGKRTQQLFAHLEELPDAQARN